jgi:hypothetical protein
MQKLIVVTTLVLLFTSCSTKAPIDKNCEIKSMQLQQRIDSLETALNDLKAKMVDAQSQQKKSKKKKGDKNQLSPELGIPMGSVDPLPTKNNIRNPASYSGQCMAITKRGTQCKRAARSGGYCWQHGG